MSRSSRFGLAHFGRSIGASRRSRSTKRRAAVGVGRATSLGSTSLSCELLEPRTLLAADLWSGLGDTSAESYVATAAGAAPQLPAVGGLVLHLESDQGVTTGGSSLVTSWVDSSGKGNDLVTPLGDPELVAIATPSGLPAVEFDGDDGLSRLHSVDAVTDLPLGGADRTMFLVAKYDGANGWAGATYGNGVFNGAFGLVVNSGIGQLAEHGWGVGNDFASGQPGVGAGWLTQSTVLSDNTLRHYRDGSLIDTDTHTFNTQLSKIVVGQEISGKGFADLEVAAVLIYDRALNDIERQEIDDYLETKYLTIPPGPPTFLTSAAQSIAENLQAIAALEVNSATSATLAITGGADAALFELAGANGNQLQFLAAPDFEAPSDTDGNNDYLVQVTATNGEGATQLDMTVTVVNVASAPPFTSPATYNQPENQQAVGTFMVDSTEPVFFTVSDGADAALFQLTGANADELQFVAPPDFEAPGDDGADNVYDVQVMVANSEGSRTLDLQVTITDVGAPQFTSPDAYNVRENERTVGTLTVANPSGVVFALDSGADLDRFQLTGANGDMLEFVDAPNFDAPGDNGADNIYNVKAIATSAEGATPINLAITVTDVVNDGCNVPGSPVICLDAATGVTVDGETSAVSEWADQSGHGNTLTSTGSRQPILPSETTPAGEPFVRFDGVDDVLARTLSQGLNDLPAGNASRSTFLVARFHDANGWGGASYGRAMFNEAFGVGVVAEEPNEGSLFLQGWGGTNDIISNEKGYTPGVGSSGWIVLSAVHVDDGTDPAINARLYVDGSSVASNTRLYATNVSDAMSRIALGQEIANFGSIQVDVAAWLLYDEALDDAGRMEVENYLQTRFLGEVGETTGDFDADGDADGFDFLAWQRGFGLTTGAQQADGDADADGEVAADDLAAWALAFGSTATSQGAASSSAVAAVAADGLGADGDATDGGATSAPEESVPPARQERTRPSSRKDGVGTETAVESAWAGRGRVASRDRALADLFG